MATSIRPIPVLTGKSAKKFNQIAKLNYANRKANNDLNKDIAFTKAILSKANL